MPLTSARDWRYERFLLVGVDEASEPPSGCSIDAMAGVLKEVGANLGLTFLDYAPVFFKDGEEIRRVNRADGLSFRGGRQHFRRLWKRGLSLLPPVVSEVCVDLYLNDNVYVNPTVRYV